VFKLLDFLEYNSYPLVHCLARTWR